MLRITHGTEERDSIFREDFIDTETHRITKDTVILCEELYRDPSSLTATQLDLEAKVVGLHMHNAALQQIISAPKTMISAELQCQITIPVQLALICAYSYYI